MKRFLLPILLLGCVACSETSTSGAVDDPDITGDVGQDVGGDDDGMEFDGLSDATDGEEVLEDVRVAPTCAFGDPCDDGEPCTHSDACDLNGECGGTNYSCEDGRDCTVDTCEGDGTCTHPLLAGTCLIANVCRSEGSSSALEPCRVCDPGVATTEWTVLGEGARCDDGTMCTVSETCVEGVCQGGTLDCDDSNPCTSDACVTDVGCVHGPQLNSCDDGNACTSYDQCDETGVCAGLVVIDCVDGETCTLDVCDPLIGCTHPALDAVCSDGDLCTVGDVCNEGVCEPGASNPCSDGNSCTLDACDPGLGCVYSPIVNSCCVDATSVCEDGDPCTIDSCDPEFFVPGTTEGCIHLVDEGPCNDGDACTLLDTCTGGSCVGSAKSCDDGNACTADFCEESGACVHASEEDGLPCDDGVECTNPDACASGICVGDASPCTCTPDFPEQVQVITSLVIGADGTPGEALDVDGNPATCSPSSACSEGADNALSVAGSFVNSALVSSIADGSLVISFAHEGWSSAGGDYTLLAFTGAFADAECDALSGGCSILVEPETLDDACQPVMALPASAVDSTVVAGGPGNNLPILFPVGDAVLSLNLYAFTIEATLTVAEGGIVGMEGVMGGAIRKADLFSALESVPPEQLPAGLDAATLTLLLDGLVVTDIDTDGDGVADAASVGFVFGATPAVLAGVIP